MSTFYVLPPRPVLGERLAEFLRPWFPDLRWDAATRDQFADALGAAAVSRPDAYVVYREELADGEPVARALVNAFGAEDGDEVIEIRPGARPGEMTAARWRVEAA